MKKEFFYLQILNNLFEIGHLHKAFNTHKRHAGYMLPEQFLNCTLLIAEGSVSGTKR